MAMTTDKKEKKQSKGPAGMTEEELKDLKFKKKQKNIRSGKPASRTYTPRGMEMGPDLRSDEEKKQDAINALLGDTVKNLKLTPEMLRSVAEGMKPLKDGGEVKKYKKGGAVKKNKSNMITTKGWGASRKT